MSDIGIKGLDRTVAETNVWLKLVGHKIHREERRHAYSALRAVLHALRDRLTVEETAHFAAQLPILVRGVFYEGWRPAIVPMKVRHADEFGERVARELPSNFDIDPVTLTRQVFEAIEERLDPGEVSKIASGLPPELKALWPSHVRLSDRRARSAPTSKEPVHAEGQRRAFTVRETHEPSNPGSDARDTRRMCVLQSGS